MSSTHYKLTISNPCANEWDSMAQTAGGRFCSACSKNVVDFTNQSESEIKEYFQKHAGEKICGRLYTTQIDRIRIEFDKDILHSEIRFWQKFLVVLLVCFGNEVFGIDFCIAQIQTDSLVPIVQIDTLQAQAPIDDSLTSEQQPKTDSIFKATVLPLNIVTYPFLETLTIMGGIGYEPYINIPGDYVTSIDWALALVPVDMDTNIQTVSNPDSTIEKPVETAVLPFGFSLNEGQHPPKPTEPPLDEHRNLFVLTESKKRKRRKNKSAK